MREPIIQSCYILEASESFQYVFQSQWEASEINNERDISETDQHAAGTMLQWGKGLLTMLASRVRVLSESQLLLHPFQLSAPVSQKEDSPNDCDWALPPM